MASLPCCQLHTECNQYFIRYNDGLEAFHRHLLSDDGSPFLLLVFWHVLTGMGTKFCQISVCQLRLSCLFFYFSLWNVTTHTEWLFQTDLHGAVSYWPCTPRITWSHFMLTLHPWTDPRLVTAGYSLHRVCGMWQLTLSDFFKSTCMESCHTDLHP